MQTCQKWMHCPAHVESEHFALPDMYGQVQLSSLGQASGITGPVLPETNLLFTAPPFRLS
ncbi:hypothetical protein T09_15043 [Trichinella sp. T9]|uniref:Uncharacterized protein n=1 Tax=Trichinella murrelli TaxID=144512 RepID=A0A0V0UFN8_9BILA|nr:hypothetical protein T05_16260 [Trichinella murrelli]KRX62515.1 hypothetical protein T09_15043 [Trichinella sp. T9]